jgi:hypothetical protein
MPRSTWVQNNFNSGEWSPWVSSRADLGKYKNALETCVNYLPTIQGALTRRPGSRYVAATKYANKETRLQRFEFSITQAYVLEFGDLYIRFFTNEGQLLDTGLPYEVVTPYLETEVFELNFTQSADVLYIAHPNHPPMKLQRLGATNWTLTEINFLDGPYLPVNATTTTLLPSGTTGSVTVTASAATFAATDVGRILRIKCGGAWLWGPISGYSSTTSVTWDIQPAAGSMAPYVATGTANVSGSNVVSVTVTDGGSGYGVKPPAVSFSGGGGSGASAYASLSNGVVTTITMTAVGSSYSSAPTVTIAAPSAIVPSTTTFWRLGSWSDTLGWPNVVTFHEDRLWFGGSAYAPQRVDSSNSGDYENFSPTAIDSTVIDSNSVAINLNADTVNAIKWLVSDERGLLAGTAGGEWMIRSSSLQEAITPTKIQAKSPSPFGSHAIAAIKIGKSTMFIQRGGRKLRELSYVYVSDGFEAADLSVLSEQVLISQAKQMAVQLNPHTYIWVVKEDGTLASCVFDKHQEVVGWTRHTPGGRYYDYTASAFTDARVESVACIPSPSGTRDTLWWIVNRNVGNAEGNVRYVEYSTKMWENGDTIENGVFVDSSAEYSGVATTTVSGLTWLAGETVSVLTDGSVHPDVTVSAAGVATLQWSATKVQIGCGYTSEGKTLRIEAGGGDGTAQGKYKRLHRVIFRLYQSVGLSVLSNQYGEPWIPEPFRSSADPMNAAVSLFTGDKRWAWEGSYELEGQVYWKQDQPLPSNIGAIVVQLETQDGG